MTTDDKHTLAARIIKPSDWGTVPPLPTPDERRAHEKGYRKGFADAVKQLAYGGAPMRSDVAEVWYQMVRDWKHALHDAGGSVLPPSPTHALHQVRQARKGPRR